MNRITIPALAEMKRQGRKIVGVVAWDTPMAQLAERAGVDLLSVGDSVGKNLWGHATETEVTVDEMLVVCKAVRRGAQRALVSCDVPAAADAVTAGRRLVDEGRADMIKVHAAPEVIRQLAHAGVAVFAEFHGGRAVAELVDEAKRLEGAGAAMLDFRHSGPEAGNPGDRRPGWRPVARWARAHGACGDRLWHELARLERRDLCACREHRAGGARGVRRGRARGAANQGTAWLKR